MKIITQPCSLGYWLAATILLKTQLVLCAESFAESLPEKIRVFVDTDAEGVLLERDLYRIELLRLVLEKSPRPAELDIRFHSEIALSQGEFINVLDAGRIDIAWSMTSKQREKAALPIRVPIYRGLMGWRIGFIRASDRARFSQLAEGKDLKQVLTGQGPDWPDTKILQHNGFQVESRLTWPSRFKMLLRKRFDYFPRSIIEIWGEQKETAGLAVEVEENFAISYPTAFYFFASNKRPDIASLVEEGLMAAVNDGSFEALFMQFHRHSIKRARLEKRKILYLENPLLPPETPLQDSRLWYLPVVN